MKEQKSGTRAAKKSRKVAAEIYLGQEERGGAMARYKKAKKSKRGNRQVPRRWNPKGDIIRPPSDMEAIIRRHDNRPIQTEKALHLVVSMGSKRTVEDIKRQMAVQMPVEIILRAKNAEQFIKAGEYGTSLKAAGFENELIIAYDEDIFTPEENEEILREQAEFYKKKREATNGYGARIK